MEYFIDLQMDQFIPFHINHKIHISYSKTDTEVGKKNTILTYTNH